MIREGIHMFRLRIRRLRWLALAALTTVAAAAIASGCGSSSGSSGGSAAAAKGLDFVPKSAIVYGVFDLDFHGTAWGKVDTLLKNFPNYAAQKDKALAKLEQSG